MSAGALEPEQRAAPVSTRPLSRDRRGHDHVEGRDAVGGDQQRSGRRSRTARAPCRSLVQAGQRSSGTATPRLSVRSNISSTCRMYRRGRTRASSAAGVQPRGHLGVGLQQLAQRAALVPGAQGVALHELVGLLAGDAAPRPAPAAPAREHQAVRRAPGSRASARGRPRAPRSATRAVEHVVERRWTRRAARCARPTSARCRARARAATSSSADDGVAAQHPGQAGDALADDRVALVGHRRAALLARRRTAPRPRAPRCAAGGAARWRSGRASCRRRPARPAARRGGRAGSPASRPCSRSRPSARQHVVLDSRVEVGVGADGAGELAHARRPRRRRRSRSRCAAHLDRPAGQLEPEGGGLGVDAVRAADDRRVAVLLGPVASARARARRGRPAAGRRRRAAAARGRCRGRRRRSGRSGTSARPGPTRSATSVKASTSWCVRPSISRMRATSKPAVLATAARPSAGTTPSSAQAATPRSRRRATAGTGARPSRRRPSQGGCNGRSRLERVYQPGQPPPPVNGVGVSSSAGWAGPGPGPGSWPRRWPRSWRRSRPCRRPARRRASARPATRRSRPASPRPIGMPITGSSV